LRELEKKATTVQPTVDATNDLLKSFGIVDPRFETVTTGLKM
jgi:hypothetical protein